MLRKVRDCIHKEQFYPTVVGMFLNPFYFARKGLFKELQSLAHHIQGRVLDVGCGQKPYTKIFGCKEYIGLEIDCPENRKNKKADLFYDGKYIPAEDNSFDSIVCSQVFEHVFTPDDFLRELHRVLKPAGKVLMTVPLVWDEHEQPIDYARYSSFGLKFILEKNKFQIVEQKKSMAGIRVIFQLLNAYLYKITVTNNPYLNLCTCLLLMSPFNILGELLSKILPQNNDLYLNNIIVAKKSANECFL